MIFESNHRKFQCTDFTKIFEKYFRITDLVEIADEEKLVQLVSNDKFTEDLARLDALRGNVDFQQKIVKATMKHMEFDTKNKHCLKLLADDLELVSSNMPKLLTVLAHMTLVGVLYRDRKQSSFGAELKGARAYCVQRCGYPLAKWPAFLLKQFHKAGASNEKPENVDSDMHPVEVITVGGDDAEPAKKRRRGFGKKTD